MAITLSSAPADEKSVEVAIQHARDAVTEAQEDDGWVLIKAEMLALLLLEIEQLRLDREQYAGNAKAVIELQEELRMVRAYNERLHNHLNYWEGRPSTWRPALDVSREHLESEHCWCKPTLNDVADDGTKHWIHHEPN